MHTANPLFKHIVPGAVLLTTLTATAWSRPVTLTGVIRDFPTTHVDFDTVPSSGFGHYAGNVMPLLGADGRPQMAAAVEVVTELDDFVVDGGIIIPQQDFAAQVEVLGAAITYGGQYDIPVTVEIKADHHKFRPFGHFELAMYGNVNDGGEYSYTLPTMYDAGTELSIRARSWVKHRSYYSGSYNSHWKEHLTIDSNSGSPNVLVLRNGDDAPERPAFDDQANAVDFIEDYLNTDTGKIVLEDHQAIFFFELGTTNVTNIDADFQDLVCLVTFATTRDELVNAGTDGDGGSSAEFVPAGYKVLDQWRDAAGNAIAPHTYDAGAGDAEGRRGVSSNGAMSSPDSFNEWFHDSPGMSALHTIELTETDPGVFEYASNAFLPIDDELGGNEGKAHNWNFTYDVQGTFSYQAGTDQFFELTGGDGAFLYIDGRLAIDLGGLGAVETQRVNLDRFGLGPEEEHTFQIFYANRQPNQSIFRFRTNVFVDDNTDATYTVSGGWD